MRITTAVVLLLLLVPTTPVIANSCPELAGSYPYGSAVGVAMSGIYAYYSSGPSLMVADISNPALPQVVGEVALPGVIEAVETSGSYAYVAAGDAGLQVVDISNPLDPQRMGYCETPSPALDVSVSGGYAYVAAGESGLRKIDVVDPYAPAETGYLDPPGMTALSLVAEGYNAYVLYNNIYHYQLQLFVVNVSHPHYLYDTGRVDFGGLTSPLVVLGDVALSGGVVYCLASGSMALVDVTDPLSPVVISELDIGSSSQRKQGVALSPGFAFAASEGHLRVIDVGDPAAPFEVGVLETPGEAVGVAIGGSHAFLADGSGGLRMIDISSPSSPIETGFIDTPGSIDGVSVSFGIAHLADGSGRFRVLNVIDPSTPVEEASLEVPGGVFDVAEWAPYVYAIGNDDDGISNLRVFDVWLPPNPVEIGFVTAGFSDETFRDVEAFGNYALVAAGRRGLRVFQIVDISEIGFCYTPSFARDVSVSGDYAYVVDTEEGLRVIDISNVATPLEVGEAPMANARGVEVAGNYAYVVTDQPSGLGLTILDVTDPILPNPLGTTYVSTDGDPVDVAVSESIAYVAVRDDGMRVIDCSDPLFPHEVGAATTPGNPSAVATSEGYVYLADGNGGLRIYHTCSGAGLFADKFESGDTSAWSRASP